MLSLEKIQVVRGFKKYASVRAQANRFYSADEFFEAV
jgi:hypothetical protein